MTRRRTHARWLPALTLLLGLAPAACSKQQTILLVEVAGPAGLDAHQLDVTVTAGLDTPRAFMIPETPDPSAFSLPVSFTITLDSTRMGPITVSVDALDLTQSPVGYGTTMMQHIVLGGQTVVEVMLSDQLPPQDLDGGADAAEAAVTGPDAGGAAGTDGAADADAARDASAEEMGLDGATD
jgi:hypothetical protein